MSALRARYRPHAGRWLGSGIGLVVGSLLLVACGRSGDGAAPSADASPALAPPTLADMTGLDDRDNRMPKSAEAEALRVDRIDPCALLTRDEAEAIVRARLLDARQDNLGSDRPSCTYGADPAGTTAQVQIFVGDGADSLIAVNRRLGGDNIEVEELGDGAFLRHTTLHFHVEGVPVVLSVVRLVDAKTLHPAMISAARTIAERIVAPLPTDDADGRGDTMPTVH